MPTAPDGASQLTVVLLVYWPLILVLIAAVAAGVAILVRRLRHRNDNPFIVPPPDDK